MTDNDLLGEGSVLLFLQYECPPCKDLIEELSDLGRAPADVPLWVLTDEAGEASALNARGFASEVLFDEGGAVASAFLNSMFPYAFVVDPEGVLTRKGVANTVEDIQRLVREGASWPLVESSH